MGEESSKTTQIQSKILESPMSKPTKLAEKNITPEKRSPQLIASVEKRQPAKKNPKKPAPEKKRKALEEGLKRKQGENEVKESRKAKRTLEEKKNANAEDYQGVIRQSCIKKFLKLKTFGWAGQVLHNIVMHLADHSGVGDALWFEVGEDLGRFSIKELCLITGMKCVGFTYLAPAVDNRLMSRYFSILRAVLREHLEVQLSNAKFDNDDEVVKLVLLCMIFCIPLANANFVKINPQYFALADNLEEFNAFPWGLLSWEATRAAIEHTAIAGKFTTKHVEANPRMLHGPLRIISSSVGVNTSVGHLHNDWQQCFVMMPIDKEMKKSCVAQLYSKKDLTVMPQAPCKTHVTQPSTAKNSDWLEFQKEIRGERNPTTAYHVSYRHKRDVQNDDSDALKTDSKSKYGLHRTSS
ncbi:hypothetical protein TIFTF001_034871 [Ficus carica]|uniref:DUF1985 domain-containing protein n=1 Tax=Ficus carica TaxID=3494 RepID=A0AA88E4I6_FICCA|nr:hypothetical protein TIFTF001_034864 [Ficus carica]GMN65806.1 hypothetical protein TIFTF001_034871 [Ficus carica]